MTTGFGVTMWCLDGLQTGRYVGGRRALAQSLYRRLTTPRGTLRGGDEESTYGLDLAGEVGAAATSAQLAALPIRIAAELRKDDRVERVRTSATVTSTSTAGEHSVLVVINVTPADATGTFTLTLAVSGVTVELIGGLPE